ncbi:Hypothetical predicted protein [Paramuricea clavata]|uniref:Uncharacterized protein n=2 Tax=Paramuricea clavata TaxID=317549 RepID=A0A6S7JMQ1_PARCT|nr:Hypothetical predicted protein [Paramuricea clavata]
MLGIARMYPTLQRFTLWLCLMYISAALANKNSNKCGKGQYKSDFLSGGCAQCPRILRKCESQEIDDARRCFIACGRILSTQTASLDTTHATPELRKSSTSPTRTTTQAPEIRKTATTKGVSNTLSSGPHYVIIKDVLTISTSSNFSDKQSGYNNWTDIKFGIAVTVLALLLVIGICFVLWWKGRSNSRNNEQRNSVYYGPVCPDSRSNSDQNINGETSENTGEADDVEDIGSSFGMRMSSAVSHEDFENMPEAHV